ncbi:hypothetical protein JW752_02635 [Candidatus Peregrinibacteria bacterium]|nr:hypothetical protein [Candidatus Peregrinibacteria bacterium]
MNKKSLLIVIVLLLLAVAVGGYLGWARYYKNPPSPAIPQAEQAVINIQKTVESASEKASQGVLPAIDPSAINPMQNVPDINPYKNTNPFADIKTNPFE